MTTQLDDDLRALADVRAKARAARTAFDALEGATQEDLDHLVRAMARAGHERAEDLARLAVDETGYGIYENKIIKNRYNSGFVAQWMLERRAVGVLWTDPVNRVTAIGTPVGVIAAIIPVTNPTSTALFKSLAAVKSGNAVVHAPHPRATRCTNLTAEVMAEAAVAAGAPDGLVGCLEAPTLSATAELMASAEVNLVLATGGPGMVRAAYSSGKPTIAVGAGNVPAYVGRSCPDPAEAAEMIISSKSFDNGTACVAEQSVVVEATHEAQFMREFEARGAYWMSAEEQDRLAAVLFDERGGLRPDAVGQTSQRLAQMSGFSVPESTRVLACELDKVGMGVPLSREILGPVLSVYRAADPEAGWRRCREILALGGEGHTVALHATDPAEIEPFSTLPAGRIVVNTPALIGGMGYSTAVDPSFQLGTGTWSGSICSDNVTPLHLINIKRLAHEVRPWRGVFDGAGIDD